MCRNIRTLYNFEPAASDDEVRAAALQYVRKISGFTKPSKANEAAFEHAVEAVTAVSRELLASLIADDGAQGPVADGLARPGEPGTLDDRMLGEPLRSAVRAKTGTLLNVTSLSGWLRTRPERDLAFAFIQNTGSSQVDGGHLALQERLLEAMVDHPVTPPREQLSPLPPGPAE